MAAFDERVVVTVARWTARAVGTAILALVVAIAIGEGVPNPLAQPVEVNLLSVAMLTMMTGLIIAWKWEGVGGLLILGGFGFFAAVNHGIRLNVVFGPLLATGLMYLACWWMNKSPSPPRSRSGLGSRGKEGERCGVFW